MFLAALVFSGGAWIAPAAVFAGAMLCLLLWTYRGTPAQTGIRAAAIGLKLLGVLTLAACLIEPLWTAEHARPGANLFAVVADNSEGMRIKDRGTAQSRADFLRGLLSTNAGWLAKLEDQFQLRRYYFDSRLQGTPDFSTMAYDGRSSAIGYALRNIADSHRGQPLGGILLLSDGNATDLADGKFDATGLPPVYPVVIGHDESENDIGLQRVAVSQTAFEDAPVNVQADVVSAGYTGQNVTGQLLDAEGKTVTEQTIRAPSDGEVMPFRFELKPTKSGVSFYHLRVSAKDELSQFDKPETSREATLANNTRLLMVNRGKGPYRVLYVAGRPKWEFKFMNRALDGDDQVELVSLIRVAKREPKFEFRGRVGESSNPLFRGFDNQPKDEVESYDQPVLERLNTRDTTELAGGFPTTAEELYGFNAVVVDDLEADFFTRDQMTLLQKFVSERGGGFLMMGGVEAFHEGKYDRTPVGDMLPVYLDHQPDGPPVKDAHLTLTHEGWLQPWARLRGNEADERARLEAMPPVQTVNRVREVKPGANAIATVHDDNGDYPALVVQRFGNGRVGALMISDLWRWGFHDAAMHKDMDKAWRQLYRWLIADVPEQIDFQVAPKPGDPNQAMTLQVRVRDKAFKPMDNVSVVFLVRTITNGVERTSAGAGTKLVTSSEAVKLTADPSGSEAGLYEGVYVPRVTGGYVADAIVTDANGAEIGRAQAGWTADPAAEEYRSLRPNRALMEMIAKQTGGEVISADKLDAFAAALPNRRAPVMESWATPLWHRPVVFLFALACFIAEWGLRRWKGLA